ncbi:uncharacterized protein LOC116776158 [Danaus plexippus]|nr:uncharacterized protein LOC116776158 [Danaus plexippus]
MDEQYLKEQLNIGKLIKERVSDSLRNVDVLNVLKKMVESAPESEETEEIRQQLDGILTQYNSLPEEQKVQFARQVKEALTNKLAKKLEEAPLDFSEVETFLRDAVRTQIYLYSAAAVVFVIIVVFFGYKLYKSIKEKEKKKEEKKKLKQMKKKK